ncbi:hypothetical protein IMCC3135_28365 [Granulosicoccus antarcticus IMCC3135]|uniref:Uncharacterized protein n=1 Tax=Granulosicoccus antarcticus IMCC3135 TaxID=1192854 RepID=A0A2Z2NZ69_9GAMM|nr:hypothetical protein IMCC3135_28365 [Granulosicoccus antarcticus IMCC3135]
MEWTKTSVVPVITYKVFWQLVCVTTEQRDTKLLTKASGSNHMIFAGSAVLAAVARKKLLMGISE